MTLSEIIINYRKEHGLSQRKMSSLCNVSVGYISMLEKGINYKTGEKITPTIAVLNKISKAMGISFNDLAKSAEDINIDFSSEESDYNEFFPSNKIATTADRLRQIMKERHLRATDVVDLAQPICEKTGVHFSKSSLSQYMHGTYSPDEEKLYILSSVLDVNPAWLMGYDVPKERADEEPAPASSEAAERKEAAFYWIRNEATKAEKIELLKELVNQL